MNRQGKIVRASTIEDLPKKTIQFDDPFITVGFRLRNSLNKKLIDKTEEWGYSKQEIINKAIEAFLK